MALTNEEKRRVLEAMIAQEENDLWGLSIELKKQQATAIAIGALKEPEKGQFGKENTAITQALDARIQVIRARLATLQEELKSLG